MKSRKTVLFLLTLISLMWIMHTLTKNFVTDPEFSRFLGKKDQSIPNPELWGAMLRVHIVLAVISLITGPIGTLRKIRLKWITLHKWNGRIYVISILLNFIPGLYVAFFATGGWLSVLGFLILNSLWLGTTLLGYVHIQRKDIGKHTKWITRSFFLTFANLAIYLLLMLGNHGLKLPYEASYIIAVWGSFVLNLLLAELVIRKQWIQ